MKSLLLLTPEPLQGASSRLRAIDLMPFWASRYQVTHLSFLSEKSYSIKDQPGGLLLKAGCLVLDALFFLFKYIGALVRADVVLIHRNISPLGPPLLEALAFAFGKPVVYDFDDAIYLNPETAQNQWLAPLKMNAYRTDWMVRRASAVLAGNQHLASYALQRNANVHIVPTGLDLAVYAEPNLQPISDRKVIGWIGSRGTETFVHVILPVLKSLMDDFEDWQIHLVGANFDTCHERILCLPWSLETEIQQMRQFSIGINPLEDNDFTRGKCGFKVVQYQALGIPSVSSPVGICLDQVVENVTGFLPTDLDQWRSSLQSLMSSTELLTSMGKAAQPLADQYDQQKVAEQIKAVIEAL